DCFFFQAEDGIRDKLVTGVQTCALPISARRLHSLEGRGLGTLAPRAPLGSRHTPLLPGRLDHLPLPGPRALPAGEERLRAAGGRSEERRVGKECRSRRTATRETKKKQRD